MCAECEAYKKDLSGLVQEVNLALQSPGRRVPRDYNRNLNGTVEHMKKVHKLVDRWHYIGIAIGIGTAIGAGISAVLGDMLGDESVGAAIGPALGIGLGAAVGAYLDNKARREGRVI
jgi:hypothetical protein